MKAKKGMNLREVCGEQILVAEGKENIDFTNVISMNESSAFLWNEIQGKDFTAETLAEIMVNNYQIDENTPLDRETALRDAENLIKLWKEAEIVEE